MIQSLKWKFAQLDKEEEPEIDIPNDGVRQQIGEEEFTISNEYTSLRNEICCFLYSAFGD